MEKKEIKFGLRHKDGKMISFYIDTLRDDSHYVLQKQLDKSDPLWLVNDVFLANYVKNVSTAWYNAGYNTPNHSYSPDDLEVVRYEIVVKEKVEKVDPLPPPNFKELMKFKRNKFPKESRHYENLLKEYENSPNKESYIVTASDYLEYLADLTNKMNKSL